MPWDTMRQSRQPMHRWSSAWVAFGSSLFVLGLGILLWKLWDFRVRNPSDAIGWVTVHQYPKQQEMVAYVGAFVCVLLGVLAGWLVWCGLARWCHRRCGWTLSRSLNRTAWLFSGYAFVLFPMVQGHWDVWNLCCMPLGLFLLGGGILGLYHIITRKIKGDTAPSSAEPGVKAEVLTVASPDTLQPHSSTWWQNGLLWLLIPALLFAFFYDGRNIHGDVDLFHEGERLAPLNALVRGGIPFRDIYVQHGLFQNVGKAWVSTWGGELSLRALRLTERWMAPFGYIALYALGLVVFRSWVTSILLVLISQSFGVTDRHALGLLAITALAHAIRRNQLDALPSGVPWWRTLLAYRYVLLAGVLTTLAFFFSTEIGLYTFAACGAFLVIRGLSRRRVGTGTRWLPLLFYAVGGLTAAIPFLVFFGWHGALDDLVQNTYIQCVYQIPTWGLPFPSLPTHLTALASFGEVKTFLMGETFRWYLPVIVYLVVVGWLAWHALRGAFWEQSIRPILLLVLLEGVMLFRTALGRSDLGHLNYGSIVLWVFPLVALESTILACIQRIRVKPLLSSTVPRLVLWMSAAMVFGWYVHSVHRPFNGFRDRVRRVVHGETLPQRQPVHWERLGGPLVSEAQQKQLQQVVAFIQQNTRPDEPILDFSNQGAYYFFAEHASATRYHQIAYASTPAMQREVIRDLERTQAPLVIYQTGGWADNIDGIPSAERHPLIASYLQRCYTPAIDINGTVIWSRIQELPPDWENHP